MSNQITPERIKELRDMIAGLPNNPWKGILFNDLLEALDTIEARNARIAELEAALNPFANEASEYDQGQFEDRDSPYFNTFNIGQLRTSRAALNHKEPAA